MRVAIVTETYPPEINGVALTVHALAEGLATRGHAVEVLRPRQSQNPEPGTANAQSVLLPGMALPRYPGLRMGFPVAYLTIEHKGSIPEDLRPALGNRIFGCDDCQLVCPWNRYARASQVPDFAPRHGLDAPILAALFAWDEATWQARTEGMALRRAGYSGWLRNLAVALGNAPPSPEALQALAARAQHRDALVREHVAWALAEQQRKAGDQGSSSDAPTV